MGINLRTETDPVSETLWDFLSSTYKTMDKVQNKPNSSVQHFCYWGDHCTIRFVFCALRHIVELLFVSFLERVHISLADHSAFYVVFFVVCVF
jgi:hypothetical protein